MTRNKEINKWDREGNASVMNISLQGQQEIF